MSENRALAELKKLITKHKINPNTLSLRAKIPQPRLSEILRNRRRFTPETDLKLCTVFGIKSGFFINLQTKHELELASVKYKDILKTLIPF